MLKNFEFTVIKETFYDQILLKGHDARFEGFTIILKENKRFKLRLKETLLIKLDNQT